MRNSLRSCAGRHSVSVWSSSFFYPSQNRERLFRLGPRSEWYRMLAFRAHDERWPEGREYFDVPALIADCIITQGEQPW